MADGFLSTSFGLSGPIVTSNPSFAAPASAAASGGGFSFAKLAGPLAAASFGLNLLGQRGELQQAREGIALQRRFAEALQGFEPDLVQVPELPGVDIDAAVEQSTRSLLDGVGPATQAAARFNDFVAEELESAVPGISDFLATASARSDELLQTELTSLDAGPSDLRRRLVAETVAARQPAGGTPFNDALVTSLLDSTLQENLARRGDERATLALGQSLGGFALAGARQVAPFSGTEFLPYTSVTSGQTIELAFQENMARFNAALNAEIANSQLQTELGLTQLQAETAGQAKGPGEGRIRATGALGGAAAGAAAGSFLGPPGAIAGGIVGAIGGLF